MKNIPICLVFRPMKASKVHFVGLVAPAAGLVDPSAAKGTFNFVFQVNFLGSLHNAGVITIAYHKLVRTQAPFSGLYAKAEAWFQDVDMWQENLAPHLGTTIPQVMDGMGWQVKELEPRTLRAKPDLEAEIQSLLALRTTLYPERLTRDDVEKIAQSINGQD